MKKLTLTMVCALGLTGAAFAQGTVHWDAISAAAFTSQTNATTYSALFGGGAATGNIGKTGITFGTYFYELLYLPNSVSSTYQPGTPNSLIGSGALNVNNWVDTGLEASNAIATGVYTPLGNENTIAATVPWATGTTDNIVMVGWSGNLGTTWSGVLALLNGGSSAIQGQVGLANSFFGISATGFINPNAGNPGAVIFANAANASGTPIFSLNTQLYLLPVPEPATLALAGLGGLSLLLFRRQRK